MRNLGGDPVTKCCVFNNKTASTAIFSVSSMAKCTIENPAATAIKIPKKVRFPAKTTTANSFPKILL